ncbi:MAG TPA: alkaline phosphatase D family protein [Methylomirabilota bacterium]|nr:alkaline phosphatase D family protein [Methylomirabilota bacterium]
MADGGNQGLRGPRAGAARTALLLLLLLAAPAVADEPGLLVTLGEVTDASAVLWVRGQTWGRVTVRYSPAGGSVERQHEIKVSPAGNLTGKLLLGALKPGTRYRYTASQNNQEVQGEFVTAPPAHEPARLRFAWSGDLGGRDACRPLSGYPIFRTLSRFPVDFFLFVGDTVYADVACGGPDRIPGYDFVARTLPDFWAKHRYNREDPAVQAYFRQVAVYAVWDDHEVRNNFAGSADRLMETGRRAFFDYFPILPTADEPGRLYRKFSWGRLLDVFILDTRQYRSSNADLDGPGKTMLGAAQRRWLIDGVAASTATWKVVVTSVSLSVPTGGKLHDSWSNANILGFPEEKGTGFAYERDAILRTFRERGVKNLIFLATDVHHAELIRHHPTPEWSFHEFIAGPLSATLGRPRPLDMGLNPRTLFAVGEIENFGEVAIDSTGLTVRIIDIDGQVRFTHTIGPD